MFQFVLWKAPLLTAQSANEVRRIMGDYLKTLRCREIEALPPSCWDALTDNDIPGSAQILNRERRVFLGDSGGASILHEVARTYVAASSRMAQLDVRREPVRSLTPRTAHR